MNAYPKIFIGSEAKDSFGHLVARDPERMRRESAEAFARIYALIASRKKLLNELLRRT